MEDPLVGKLVLGRYRIVRRIAKGGMGTIYLARNEGSAGFVKPVVVKRILPGSLDEATAIRLFQREARIMSHLRHPGIVDVIDFTHDDDDYIMVLDYVHGYHLAKWCYFVRKTHGRFPVEPAVHIVISVLDALDHAHTLTGPQGESLQVVHRDIKPSNVLVDTSGNVKLLDFGIAQMVTDRTAAGEGEGAVRGTFPYMPPELFKSGEPGPASDTYACAVVLHEALAGRNEFRVKDISLTVARVLQHEPTRLDTLRSDISKDLADVVARQLAKDPAGRYPDARAFADALRAVRRGSVEDGQRQLAERARADFHNPRFASLLRVDELDVLEQAWRQGPAIRPERQRAPTATSPTVSLGSGDGHGTRARGSGDAPAPASSGRTRGLAIAAAVVVLGAAATAGVLGLRDDRDAEAQYILVSGDVEADDGTRAGAPEPEPDTKAAARAEDGPADAAAAKPARVRTRPPPDPGGPGALTRAFRRRQPQMRRCFDEHAEAAVGAPQLSVRFQVATDGEVESAELIPARTMKTALGGCLLNVAKATDFGPQDEAITFRIPIAVRTR